MSKRLLFSFAAGAFALSVAACAAIASPIDPGVYIGSGDAGSLTVLARSGGGGGHGGGGHGGGGFYGGGFGGGMHGGGMHGAHFAGHSLAQMRLANGRHFQNGHGHGHGHHHRHRFFIGGYPYFYYDDGFYDDDDDNCLWSRRYHRWVCPDY
ncbi:hypothetical protein [Hyphomicrobium sp.]|uniref:hypothetical protein n=1 Tax=Hyphomicrobium sp. TaxID=82 RepID=UPI0035670C25